MKSNTANNLLTFIIFTGVVGAIFAAIEATKRQDDERADRFVARMRAANCIVRDFSTYNNREIWFCPDGSKVLGRMQDGHLPR